METPKKLITKLEATDEYIVETVTGLLVFTLTTVNLLLMISLPFVIPVLVIVSLMNGFIEQAIIYSIIGIVTFYIVRGISKIVRSYPIK